LLLLFSVADLEPPVSTEEYEMTTEGAETYPVRERRAVLSLTADLMGKLTSHRISIKSNQNSSLELTACVIKVSN